VKRDLEFIKRLFDAAQASPEPTFNILWLQAAGVDYETEPAQLEFHLKLAVDEGLIECDDGKPGFGLEKSLDGSYRQWSVIPLRLTSTGQRFADAIAVEGVWPTVVKKCAHAGLQMVVEMAIGLAKDYVKRLVTGGG
jgi:hypothetical protein